ncbi:unnamed protein product [Lactuca saligna]|uniref:Uncharacterized protein n=1 Tax=Lactuca saligna TaxID=75948 RepID=A0AA35V6A3_LACSI|nr:unnamed protein product [Lactuca saligna]
MGISKAAISRAGSPINGGHFVTCLARSYGLLIPPLTRTLTCKPSDELTIGYLESIRVVTNEGSHWSIPMDDDVVHQDQPAPKLRPRGRRNVRGRGDRGQPVHQNAPMGGPNFGGDMSGYYDQLALSVNWIGGMVKNLVQHLHDEQPPHLGYHYPIFPRWSGYSNQGDVAGMSGANEDEEDD